MLPEPARAIESPILAVPTHGPRRSVPKHPSPDDRTERPSMLFLYELHDVIGARDDEFEGVVRDELLPTLAKGDDARLLWSLNLAVGRFYSVVTITAVRDGAALE